MWERHQDVPLSRWDGILNFARDKLSHPRLSWPNIDVGSLVSSISHKKTTTSGGLDGVTLADLKAMPLAAHSNFVSMYYHAEATGEWPQQVIAGRVTCIAKHACPMDALDFRPITVLGLLYRCWSTYHARQAIRAIDGLLPTGLYGSRASHQARFGRTCFGASSSPTSNKLRCAASWQTSKKHSTSCPGQLLWRVVP